MDLLPTFHAITPYMSDYRVGDQPPTVVWSAAALALQGDTVTAGATWVTFEGDTTSWRIVLATEHRVVRVDAFHPSNGMWTMSGDTTRSGETTISAQSHAKTDIRSWTIEEVRELSTQDSRQAVGRFVFALVDGDRFEIDATTARTKEHRDALNELVQALVA